MYVIKKITKKYDHRPGRLATSRYRITIVFNMKDFMKSIVNLTTAEICKFRFWDHVQISVAVRITQKTFVYGESWSSIFCGQSDQALSFIGHYLSSGLRLFLVVCEENLSFSA